MSKHTIPQNLIAFSGDTAVYKFTVTDNADAIVDLTGISATWILSKRVDSPILLTKTIGSGIVVTDAAGGLLEVTTIPADTEDLQGLHYWELEIVDSGGQKVTVANGTLTLKVERVA